MRLNQENYLNEVKNRVGFYSVLSHESPEVKFESFKVFQHPETPKQHFIHLKYMILDNEDDTLVVSVHEEIETFVRAREKAKRGWLCMLNQDEPDKIKEFLLQAHIAKEIDVDQIKMKDHDDKAKI